MFQMFQKFQPIFKMTFSMGYINGQIEKAGYKNESIEQTV